MQHDRTPAPAGNPVHDSWQDRLSRTVTFKLLQREFWGVRLISFVLVAQGVLIGFGLLVVLR